MKTPITHVSVTHRTTNRPNQKTSFSYAVALFLCVRPYVRTYVRPYVRTSVRPSASASIRPRPPQTGRSPDQSVVASSDFESSVNVMVFAHAESIPHGFRGCRDRYIRQLKITQIFVCPYVLLSVSGGWGALPIRTCGQLWYLCIYVFCIYRLQFLKRI